MIVFLLELYAASFFLAAFFQYEVAVSFASAVAVHECGHMLAARVFSVAFSRPGLTGTDVRICLENSRSDLREIGIIAAGPLANIAASVAVLILFRSHFWLFAELSYMMAAVNLLPISHLDGGRLLQFFMNMCSFKRAGAIIDSISLFCIISMVAFSSYRMLRFGDSFFTFFSSLCWALRRFDDGEKMN